MSGADTPRGFQPSAGMPSGMGRAFAYSRAVASSRLVVWGAIGVLGLQAGLPEGYKPSDLIGAATGALHSSELNSSREAQARTAEAIAEANARAQAAWQIEVEAARRQIDAINRSVQAKIDAANLADYACMGGSVAGLLFGKDAAQIAAAGKLACGEADRLRREIVAAQAEAARLGSAIMQRPTPITSAPGAAPPR